jgi:hypothetical protein
VPRFGDAVGDLAILLFALPRRLVLRRLGGRVRFGGGCRARRQIFYRSMSQFQNLDVAADVRRRTGEKLRESAS